MKKLLITGFEPFGGESLNPSWEAVKRLPNTIGDYSLTKLSLPVVFGKAATALIGAADSIHPDVILSIGQAGGQLLHDSLHASSDLYGIATRLLIDYNHRRGIITH